MREHEHEHQQKDFFKEHGTGVVGLALTNRSGTFNFRSSSQLGRVTKDQHHVNQQGERKSTIHTSATR
jgi:hypothetical protein